MRPKWIYAFDADGLGTGQISLAAALNAISDGRARWVADNAVQLLDKRAADSSLRHDRYVQIIFYRRPDGQPALTGKYAADSIREIYDAMSQAAASEEPRVRHIPGGYLHEEMASELAPYPNESADAPLSREQRKKESEFRWGACSRPRDRRASKVDTYRLSRPARQRARKRAFRAAVGCHKPVGFGCRHCGRLGECAARYQQRRRA